MLPYPSRDGGSVVAHGLGMSVNGQDYRSNVYLLDGTLQNDFTNGPAGSAAGTALGMESIREFRVESNAYSAEFGRNYGGQINVLTKSGTNRLRGIAYEFHRNDALDAANYFDIAGKPDFTRNQFGGAAGGPLRRDRLFYFVGYEGLRESSARRSPASCPTTTPARAACPTVRSTINRRRAPYLDRDPARQRRRRSAAASPPTRSGSIRSSIEHFFQGRLDYHTGANHQFFARYTFDDGDQRLPTDYPQFPRSFLSTQPVLHRRVPQHPVGPDAADAAPRLQPHADRPERRGHLASPLQEFVPGRGLVGDIDIGGMQRFGPQSSANLRLVQNVYSVQYDVTQMRGRHLLKAGALAEHYQDNMVNPTFSLGIYAFANMRAFLENRAAALRRPGPRANRPLLALHALRLLRAGHFQLTPRVTLNGGLRYEFTTMPVDICGRDSALINLSDPAPTVGPLYQNPTLKNLSPRVGAAWDVFGDGSTSVRGGYGLYFNTNNQQNLIVTVTNPPATPRFIIANPTFPTPPFERGVGNSIRPVQWDLENPRMHVWNVNAQRRCRPASSPRVGYAGSRGTHLFRNTDVNVPTPTPPAGRPAVLRRRPAAAQPRTSPPSS